ncbi:MAG TPA: glycosyltransferase family 4 protein [Candidatus Polarisedimenticolia bacterium]|nr:glycosyltransferase family 4 protein [Candidatus Polarisedimenticolia bacterium]
MQGQRPQGPIGIVTHSYYDEDPRVRRQAEALVAAGHAVDVYALRRPDDPETGEVGGVRVQRLDVQRHQGAGPATYLREYVSFFVRAQFALTRGHARRRYALVQVATLPDWLVFAGLPLRMTGTPLLLDLHESMPAFFASRFPGLARGPARRVMTLAERVSLAAASHCLTVNDGLRDRLVAGGLPASKIDVIANAPSLALFDRAAAQARPFMADGTLRLVYAGAVTPTYELGVVLEALVRVRELRPELPFRLDVYGRGDSQPALEAQAATLGLAANVRFHGRIPIEAVPGAIAAADVGLAPTRRDAFTDVSLSTKIFEYGALEKPVVASRLPMIERELPADALWTYEPADPASLAAAILSVADDPADRERRVAALRSLVEERSWEVEARRYVAIVERLASRSAGR